MSNPFLNTAQVNAIIRIRRGPEVDRLQFIYDDGELIYSTDKKRLYIGDGVAGEGTYGGTLVANKVWMSDSFDKLPYIEKYDLVYRTDDCGFYVLTGNQYLLPSNYIPIAGKKLINDNVIIPPIYTLPFATPTTNGGIIVSNGLRIDDGKLSIDVNPNYLKFVNNRLEVRTDNLTNDMPNATYSTFGKVRVGQNNGIDISSGTLGLRVDPNTLEVNASNELKIVDSIIQPVPFASQTEHGRVKINPNNSLSISNGNLGLKVDPNTLEVNANNELKVVDRISQPVPLASETVHGKIKINPNNGFSINNGNLGFRIDPVTLSINGNNELAVIGVGPTGKIPVASYTTNGTIQIIPNNGLNINGGNLSLSVDPNTLFINGSNQIQVNSTSITSTLAYASYADFGKIKIDSSSGLNIVGGVLSIKYDPSSFSINASNQLTLASAPTPTASYSTSGTVKIAPNNGLDISSGVLSLNIEPNTLSINASNQLEVNKANVLTYINNEIKSNPTSLVITTSNIQNNAITTNAITNNAITSDKINTNAITTEKIINGAITGDKIANNAVNVSNLNPNVADNSRGIEKTNSGIGLKLASGSGLEFNPTGELRLSAPAATSTVVVVRPSVSDSTDHWNTRSALSGELHPYFRTLTGACHWARNNLNGSVTIFVDENTVEGELQPASWNADETNCVIRFITQAKVDNITCLKGKGFKAGLYVWAKDNTKPIAGSLDFYGLHNKSSTATTSIYARYNSGGVWTHDRRISDPPRDINFNVYISNNKSLVAPVDSDSATDANFGSISNNWSDYTGAEGSDKILYFYNRGNVAIHDSRMQLTNLNLVSRFNGPDTTFVWLNNSFVWFYNVSISILGKGFYNYAPLWINEGTQLVTSGISKLLSDEPGSVRRYPGYGIAFIGNKSDPTDRNQATKCQYLILMEAGGYFRQNDWTPNKPNASILTTSIILDGDFITNANFFMGSYFAGKYEGYPVYLQNNLKFLGDRFYHNTSKQLEWQTNTNYSMAPISHNKNSEFRVYNWHNPLRKYTFNDAVDNTGKAAHGFPMFSGGLNYDVEVGGFRNSSGNASGTITSFTIRSSNDDHAYVTSNYQWDATLSALPVGENNNLPRDIFFPRIAYMPFDRLPRFQDFYVFSENSKTKTVNYGVSVRS